MKTFPTGSSSGTQMCQGIVLIDDAMLESTQSFSVVLTTNDSYVNILNERFQIFIEDNDSEFI